VLFVFYDKDLHCVGTACGSGRLKFTVSEPPAAAGG
jgi:hypothetical protein